MKCTSGCTCAVCFYKVPTTIFYVLLIINLINKRSFILERSKHFLLDSLSLFGFGFGARASCCLGWVEACFPQRMTDFELMPLLLPSYRCDLWSSNCPLCLVLVCLLTSGVDRVAPEGTTDVAVFPVTCEADTLYYITEQAVK